MVDIIEMNEDQLYDLVKAVLKWALDKPNEVQIMLKYTDCEDMYNADHYGMYLHLDFTENIIGFGAGSDWRDQVKQKVRKVTHQ
jgi:hypothetical protein